MKSAVRAKNENAVTRQTPVPSPTMNPSKKNSWKDQQQSIDAEIKSVGESIRAEIKSLEDSIHALTRRRNSLAPISSLPAEVIAAIFFLLRIPDFHGRPKSFLALRVTQVCHRWREISLENPLLWSHFDFATVSPAGATEILARTRMAPLSLSTNVYFHRPWDDTRFCSLQKELQTHLSHTRHLRLDIRAETPQLNRTLEGLILPAPILETLSLATDAGGAGRTSRVSVPDTLFNGTAPRLSSLQLTNCDIS